MHRLTRGERLDDAFPAPITPPSLSKLDSAFQLQEYIALLVREDVHNVERIVSMPGKKVGAELATPVEAKPEAEGGGSSTSDEERAVDEGCWIYEQLRQASCLGLDSTRMLTYPNFALLFSMAITTLVPSQTTRSRPDPPTHHDVAKRMHPNHMSRDESR
jgi:hypothetical protein